MNSDRPFEKPENPQIYNPIKPNANFNDIFQRSSSKKFKSQSVTSSPIRNSLQLNMNFKK